jgi:hypothetical protein
VAATKTAYAKQVEAALRAALPGGLARQAALIEGAWFVDEQDASIHGPFLANVPGNEVALFERRKDIVNEEIETMVASGKVILSRADDMLYWQGTGKPVIRYIARADIVDDIPGQERDALDGIADLAESIRDQGLLTPILLATTDGGAYHLAAGHRRLAAYEHLGEPYILARIWGVAEDVLAEVVGLLRLHENQWTQPLTEEQRERAWAEHQEKLDKLTAEEQAAAVSALVARGGELKRLAHKRMTQNKGGRPKGGNPRDRGVPRVSKKQAQDESARAAQQLAKEQGISIRAAREVIALSALEGRLEARTKRNRTTGDPSGYVPGTMVMLTAMNLLGQIQGADADARLGVLRAALKTIKEVEREDLARWKIETNNGTEPTPAQKAKEKEHKDNHDSDAVRAWLLASRGRSVNDIARKLNLRSNTAANLIEDGKQVFAEILPSVTEAVYDLGHAQQDESGMPQCTGLCARHCGQMEVQPSEVVT